MASDADTKPADPQIDLERRREALHMASQMVPRADVPALLEAANRIYGWLIGAPVARATPDSESGVTSSKATGQ